jgi:hypothetical protein
MTCVSIKNPVLPSARGTALSLTILRSHSLFELSLHPAKRYLPSASNSTDVTSPNDPERLLTDSPPIASHNLTCLSLDPEASRFPVWS